MTFTYKIKWTCIYLTFSLCLAMLCYGAYVSRQDYCVIKRPWVSVSGSITHPGTFRGGGTMYSIWYRGTTKRTGRACIKSIWVTKSEYERVMYGSGR